MSMNNFITSHSLKKEDNKSECTDKSRQIKVFKEAFICAQERVTYVNQRSGRQKDMIKISVRKRQ